MVLPLGWTSTEIHVPCFAIKSIFLSGSKGNSFVAFFKESDFLFCAEIMEVLDSIKMTKALLKSKFMFIYVYNFNRMVN